MHSFLKMEIASTSVSECESTVLERPQGRKRLRYEAQWARNKQKKRKDRGKAYTTCKGASIDKKKLVSFSCRCQYSCNSRVSLAERKHVFKEFYKISNHDDQNKYLLGLSNGLLPKGRRNWHSIQGKTLFLTLFV